MLKQQINSTAPRKPDPTEKPRLEDYGLSQEVKDRLEKLQARICLTIWIISALFTYLLLILYRIGYFGASLRPYNSQLVSELVFCTFLFVLFGVMTIGVLSYVITRLYLRLANPTWQIRLRYEGELEVYHRNVSSDEDWLKSTDPPPKID
jgi:hypothetical protein